MYDAIMPFPFLFHASFFELKIAKEAKIKMLSSPPPSHSMYRGCQTGNQSPNLTLVIELHSLPYQGQQANLQNSEQVDHDMQSSLFLATSGGLCLIVGLACMWVTPVYMTHKVG